MSERRFRKQAALPASRTDFDLSRARGSQSRPPCVIADHPKFFREYSATSGGKYRVMMMNVGVSESRRGGSTYVALEHERVGARSCESRVRLQCATVT